MPPVKKNEFIRFVADAFLVTCPKWQVVWEDKRTYSCVVGREAPGVFVFVGFGARPDRYWFGTDVGWAPTRSAFVEEKTARKNPDHKPTDGRLVQIRTLSAPRDFEYPYLRRSVGGLARPFTKYDLETVPAEQLRALMLSDLEEYALPYLCLMLTKRHGLEATRQSLGAAVLQ